MRKKYEIITEHDIRDCWKCNGKGELPYRNEEGEILYFIEEKEKCSFCKGIGKWVENHYIIIDKKNKIAFDSDNIG